MPHPLDLLIEHESERPARRAVTSYGKAWNTYLLSVCRIGLPHSGGGLGRARLGVT